LNLYNLFFISKFVSSLFVLLVVLQFSSIVAQSTVNCNSISQMLMYN